MYSPLKEESAWVLPETTNQGGMAVARRILQKVRDLRIPHSPSRFADHVTVSLGLATVNPSMNDRAADLSARADEALYQAKRSGRDRTVNRNEME
ncbi:MAG: diguanylate cyclase [Thermodesulfobacteriota bacterium]